MLKSDQIAQFIDDGFVRLDAAFSRETADQARAILWHDLEREAGCKESDPSSWTRPVVRLGHYAQPPFRDAANGPVLHAAFDQLVGPGRWQTPGALGTFPVRFPSPDDPGDAGWHVDMSFGTDHPDFFEWRIDAHSRGRALLMLFLFSDVGEDDAPTRIRIGSHRNVAHRLKMSGAEGMTLRALMADDFGQSGGCPEALATGMAGTVYLCHPFLVHSAQPHRGVRPRFMAQPPLLPTGALGFDPAESSLSPVETAIHRAMA